MAISDNLRALRKLSDTRSVFNRTFSHHVSDIDISKVLNFVLFVVKFAFSTLVEA